MGGEPFVWIARWTEVEPEKVIEWHQHEFGSEKLQLGHRTGTWREWFNGSVRASLSVQPIGDPGPHAQVPQPPEARSVIIVTAPGREPWQQVGIGL